MISHDDRYFGAADRYIRLENGLIIEEVRPLRAPGANGASGHTPLPARA
ncbi:hypothetical protein [Paraburkholderia sp. BCC1884]|nr:hypothetical protein [Paraburkholderia sp. BCC1884]